MTEGEILEQIDAQEAWLTTLFGKDPLEEVRGLAGTLPRPEAGWDVGADRPHNYVARLLTLDQQRVALAATHKALMAVARSSSDEMKEKCVRDGRVLLIALTSVVQKILDADGDALVPIAASVRSITSDLKQAYQRAKVLAKNMALAAEIISGFATLISAL